MTESVHNAGQEVAELDMEYDKKVDEDAKVLVLTTIIPESLF